MKLIYLFLLCPFLTYGQLFVGGGIAPVMGSDASLQQSPIFISIEAEHEGLTLALSANTNSFKAGLMFGKAFQFSCMYVHDVSVNETIQNRVELGIRYRHILNDGSFLDIGSYIQTNVNKTPDLYIIPLSVSFKKSIFKQTNSVKHEYLD